MKILYIECNMGAAGDMLTAALSELLLDQEAVLEKLSALNLPGVVYEKDYKITSGIRGAHMHVYVNGEEEMSEEVAHTHEHGHSRGHHHVSMKEIEEIVAAMPVSDQVKSNIMGVYQLIADAESAAHGKPVEEIHFHEVGAMDAVADVAAVCLLMEEIRADRIICSPIHVGSGTVRCRHGICPVPTPATAHILQGVPCYGGSIQGELCTPTGAALLKYFADSFGDMPLMTTEKIGLGVGNKEFPNRVNMVRVFLGESAGVRETVEELSCNLDDMTGEELGYALELLLKEGALDAFVVPIQMKKSRPGQMLTVIAQTKDADHLSELMFEHTSTLGVRRKTCSRMMMKRHVEAVDTVYGPVRVKTAVYKGIRKTKQEYRDIARIAAETGKSYHEIVKELNL